MRSDNGVFRVYLGLLTLAILAIGALLFVANRAYVANQREDLQRARDERTAERIFVVSAVESTADLVSPHAESWRDVPAFQVTVQPQNLAMPAIEFASVKSVSVQGASDGEVVAWRLSWEDETPDENVDASRFCDAVALQFPLNESASYMMGGPDQKVQILHWKAVWQKDLDEHFQDVQDLHPDYWADLYWFADVKGPARVPDEFGDPRSHAWFAARSAGNPMAAWHRPQPVEELLAEGYGTLTHQAHSVAGARGEWRDGRWSVVIHRPLRTDDPDDYQIRRGELLSFGIAVWNGDAGNVGGRKQYSQWIQFEVES